jgi:hypothetical protein
MVLLTGEGARIQAWLALAQLQPSPNASRILPTYHSSFAVKSNTAGNKLEPGRVHKAA